MSRYDLIQENSRLRARVDELEAELAERLPARHYLSQLRTIALCASTSEDLQLMQLGQLLEEALDVVVATEAAIGEALERGPVDHGRPTVPAEGA